MHLTKAATHLPAAWVAGWRDRTGPRELTVKDIGVVCGMRKSAIYNAIKPTAVPRLRIRALR